MVPVESGEVVVPVREIGNAFMVSTLADVPTRDVMFDSMRQDVARKKEVLSWIKDMQFLSEGEIVEAPPVDALARFKAFGWKIKFASQGYQVLENHFRCSREHVPERITLDYINQLVRQYAQQEQETEYDDEY